MENDKSHLLRDEVTGDWVVVAPKRRLRPDGIKNDKRRDPFDVVHLKKESIIASYGRGEKKMVVVENLFPIFHPRQEVLGRQEIIVEGQRIMRFWDCGASRITSLLDAFSKRFLVLRRDKMIKYLQAFKNEGVEAGASQPHPHSQIFALSFVPERLRDEAKRRRSALKRLKMTSHAHALSLAVVDRIIYSDKLVVAFANPAGRFAYEVRILPRRRIDNLTETTPAERRALAKALHSLLPLMKKRKFSYNFFFHDVLDERDEHFEIRFIPRAQVAGGFELDAGVYVNPVSAEIAAEEYMEAGNGSVK
ncbi:hypothetical protein KKD88_02555 [Patescibacteria group bacterium]|nr:hypothetical protein [Patescibacteria group bacterium]MBU1034798.1 hypothetical protein [Patescibacteria group bacterium]MBU1629934.1 hypothetical protein [Patescibacteria group bacterium]